jgi:hypothetical protein
MKTVPKDMVPGFIHETKNCGPLEIVEYISEREVHVKFKTPEYKTTTKACNIRRGTVKNRMMASYLGIGFLGVGPFKTKINGEFTSAYKYWGGMLTRCYSAKSLKKYPSYKDCTVCDDWLNFQVFSAWFEKNYPGDHDHFELDKDIKVKGNKVYSPETSLFVTKKQNNAEKNPRCHAKCARFLSPSGEVFEVRNIRAFCREHKLHQSYMSKVANGTQGHHKGWKAA